MCSLGQTENSTSSTSPHLYPLMRTVVKLLVQWKGPSACFKIDKDIIMTTCLLYHINTLLFSLSLVSFAVFNYQKRLRFMPLNGVGIDHTLRKVCMCAFAYIWAMCQTTWAVFEGDVWMCCSALWDAFSGRGYGNAGRACSRYDSSGHIIDPVGCVMEEETIVCSSLFFFFFSFLLCVCVFTVSVWACFLLVFLPLSISLCLFTVT